MIPFAKQHGDRADQRVAAAYGDHYGAGRAGWHPAPQEIRDAGQKIVALCKARGVDASEVALRFCLDNPAVASTLGAYRRARTWSGT